MAGMTGGVAGIVLAAGRGTRMGTPKALLQDPTGRSYLHAACRVLLRSGCSPVLAVLGARADDAARTLPQGAGFPVDIILNPAFAEGMSTSLRAGLEALRGRAGVDAAIIHLVDLPDVGEPAIERIMTYARMGGGGLRGALVRATYEDVPGHPVLIGADHFDGVLDSLQGDAGARAYLRLHAPLLAELSDLATGRDIDTPEELLRFEEGYRA